MKTSQIFLLLAFLILFGSMTSFDYELKEVYQSGSYKHPRGQKSSKLNNRNFNVIEIRSGSILGVEISQGDTFEVSVREYARDIVKVRQKGNRLIVDADITGKEGYLGEGVLTITCPELKQLNLDAIHIDHGKIITRTDYATATVFLRNFKQDSLKVTMNHASYLKLFDNQIGYLSADIGIEKHSPADMVINKTNKIGSANLNILNNGKMALEDLPVNENFRCRISDSALVRLTGASLKLIRQE